MLWLKSSICLLAALSSISFAKKHHLPDFKDQCGLHPPQSCSIGANSTNVGSCCVEKKAGLFVLSQFWDIHAGYPDQYTIHGLWSDFCDGTYPQYCDKSREYSNITNILIANKQYKLLQDMNNVWPNSQGVVDDFWAHEQNKHQTCFTTFAPDCYENTKGNAIYQGIIDYFQTAVDLHKKHDTYKALKRHGIKPGKSYDTSRVQKIIKKEFGMYPDLRCDKKGNIVEVWMYFYAQGPVKRMDIVPLPHNQNVTNCNATFIYPTKYPDDGSSSSIW
ncbi:unnamed protein product [Cunninghamella blakesleeana]